MIWTEIDAEARGSIVDTGTVGIDLNTATFASGAPISRRFVEEFLHLEPFAEV